MQTPLITDSPLVLTGLTGSVKMNFDFTTMAEPQLQLTIYLFIYFDALGKLLKRFGYPKGKGTLASS